MEPRAYEAGQEEEVKINGIELTPAEESRYRQLCGDPVDRPLAPEPTAKQIRIEALRAAAQIIAGIVSSDRSITPPNEGGLDQMTTDMAEQFAAWLEG